MVVSNDEVKIYFEKFKEICPSVNIIEFQNIFRSLYGKFYQRLHDTNEEVLEETYNQMVKWFNEGDVEFTKQLSVNAAAETREEMWCRIMRILHENEK